MNKSGKILLRIATVFAAGAVVGILYAPDKGERTRHRIKRKVRRLYDSADDIVGERRDDIEALRDQVKDSLSKMNNEIERLSQC